MVKQNDIDKMKPMVRWFDLTVLFKIIKPVIISSIFGRYADRRLIHASLDPVSSDEVRKRTDIRPRIEPDADGSVWVDYVADTGDGFSSTYSIALSVAASTLKFGEHETRRGSVLILGGDQVYPDASLSNYLERFRTPFKWALPNLGDRNDIKHPLVYAIPGNHDWYDGLTLFLALFCKKTEWPIGNWRAPQRRSYFALRLTDNVWLWGVDIALSDDVDQPQSDYFEEILNQMPCGAKLIICTATPGWQYASQDTEGKTVLHPSYDTLGYFTKIVREANKSITIPLVLSGDTHHYCRYVGENSGTHFVTAGGGGAFLHPTHHLQNEIAQWWFTAEDRLRLADSASGNGSPSASDEKARYPSLATSKRLLLGNLAFAFRHWKFSAVLGVEYALLGLLMLMWSDLSTWGSLFSNPVWWMAAALNGLGFWSYAKDRNWVRNSRVFLPRIGRRSRKLILGLCHAAAHVVILTILARVVYVSATEWLDLQFWTWCFNAYFAVLAIPLGGAIAGTVFGLYLLVTCWALGTHPNDAFSSMSLDGYKNFVRIRISGDSLTMYPIGLDAVPKHNQWKPNPEHERDEREPAVVPTTPLNRHLIEGPITIQL